MLKIRQFTFNPVQENTYVIFNDKGACVIIDPGCYFDYEYKELTDFIDTNKLLPNYLLNTHCHLDHVFGNKTIAEKYGLVLHMHRLEKKVLDYAPTSGEMWGLPFVNYSGEVIYIDEKDTIRIGDDELSILFTPGHSPGSISFYSKDGGFVVSGDVLFRSGIGRTDLPGGDFETLLNSIRGKLFTLPDEVVVYSGHGPETTIGYEKQGNPFLN
ncbi:MAG: MBL fold metallo-hydrolase [Chitinophagaceae bacterium]|nr:MBL fold metallo-hydrolase [Chitinophagaceae bacterium]